MGRFPKNTMKDSSETLNMVSILGKHEIIDLTRLLALKKKKKITYGLPSCRRVILFDKFFF